MGTLTPTRSPFAPTAATAEAASPYAGSAEDTARRSWPIELLAAGVVICAALALSQVATRANVPIGTASPDAISLDPSALPGYALRSMTRMFLALGASLVFTLAFGWAVAYSRRAEKVLVPALDILQSVPILGFLSITVTGFLALFPGSQLGLECASIFAIFTSQAWNMAFSLHHSIQTLPGDLDQASRVMRLSRWTRFFRIEVANGMIPLVWNSMMSFAGGWFFLTASEAISVNGTQYSLPGVGSYAAKALDTGDNRGVVLSIVTMAVLVIGTNVLFWRPVVAWAERFRFEESEATEKSASFVLTLLRRVQWLHVVGRVRRRVSIPFTRVARRTLGVDNTRWVGSSARRRAGDVIFGVVVAVGVAYGLWQLFVYVAANGGNRQWIEAFGLALFTLGRVIAVLVFSTLIWVPVGVWIGRDPRRTRRAQPIVQILASYPANLLFPVIVGIFVATGIGLNVGGILLMALGAQWYVLFNVIAGASATPTDLIEAMDVLGVTGWQRWRRLWLPAIAPTFVTGLITAAGGAWNASIVAEVVSYGDTQLVARGLGAYISEATAQGAFAKNLVGVTVMSLFVVTINRSVFHPAFAYVQRRYSQ